MYRSQTSVCCTVVYEIRIQLYNTDALQCPVSWSSELHCILNAEVATSTTGEALESPSSPPTLPAAPLPSLIHPYRGPECLLSLSAPHYLVSFRVPCSPLWGHLVFRVRVFWGVQGVLYSGPFCNVKAWFSRVTLLTSWPLIDWINACGDHQRRFLLLVCAFLTVFL